MFNNNEVNATHEVNQAPQVAEEELVTPDSPLSPSSMRDEGIIDDLRVALFAEPEEKVEARMTFHDAAVAMLAASKAAREQDHSPSQASSDFFPGKALFSDSSDDNIEQAVQHSGLPSPVREIRSHSPIPPAPFPGGFLIEEELFTRDIDNNVAQAVSSNENISIMPAAKTHDEAVIAQTDEHETIDQSVVFVEQAEQKEESIAENLAVLVVEEKVAENLDPPPSSVAEIRDEIQGIADHVVIDIPDALIEPAEENENIIAHSGSPSPVRDIHDEVVEPVVAQNEEWIQQMRAVHDELGASSVDEQIVRSFTVIVEEPVENLVIENNAAHEEKLNEVSAILSEAEDQQAHENENVHSAPSSPARETIVQSENIDPIGLADEEKIEEERQSEGHIVCEAFETASPTDVRETHSDDLLVKIFSENNDAPESTENQNLDPIGHAEECISRSPSPSPVKIHDEVVEQAVEQKEEPIAENVVVIVEAVQRTASQSPVRDIHDEQKADDNVLVDVQDAVKRTVSFNENISVLPEKIHDESPVIPSEAVVQQHHENEKVVEVRDELLEQKEEQKEAQKAEENNNIVVEEAKQEEVVAQGAVLINKNPANKNDTGAKNRFRFSCCSKSSTKSDNEDEKNNIDVNNNDYEKSEGHQI